VKEILSALRNYSINEILPELVTDNSNASAAPSVLPVSSNISLANQSSSDPTSNTNPSSSSDRTSSSVHHHHESSVHQKNVNDKVTGDSNHHKKQSSPSNHHHNNNQGKGSDLAHNIITPVEKRFGI